MKRPAISEIKQVNLPIVEKSTLTNGAIAHHLHDPSAKYLRFEVIFKAGRYAEESLMTSKGCSLMLKEGAGKLNSKGVSEYFDRRGSTLLVRTTLDHLIVSFVSLEEFALDLISMIATVCFEPAFQESDFIKVVRRQKQKLKNELSKTEVIAYREMTSALYGPDSPYGYNSTIEKYENVSLEEIKAFHSSQVMKGAFQIMVTGSVKRDLMKFIDVHFGQHMLISSAVRSHNVVFQSKRQDLIFTHRQAVQSSIRVYRPLFNRAHAQYTQLFLLNMVLGGFFGSRLMKKIREEEGLTYGIYSSLDPLAQSGYAYVSTETSPQNKHVVRQMIYDEMDLLCREEIPADELLMIKRYTSGQFLRMVDGPLNVIKLCRTLSLDNLPMDFFNQMLAQIWVSSSSDLLKLSQQYLRPEDWAYLEVGPELQ